MAKKPLPGLNALAALAPGRSSGGQKEISSPAPTPVPKAAPMPALRVATELPAAAGISNDPHPKVILRVPPSDMETLVKARTALAKSRRKVVDSRVYLAALHLMELNQAFLKAYDDQGDKYGQTVVGGNPRVSIRVPPAESIRLESIRTFVAENERKVNDTRIFLIALQQIDINDAFFKRYDGLAESDRRKKRRLGD